MHNFDQAIRISQDFIRVHPNHSLNPNIWLILLESNFSKNDTISFERNLQSFSSHARFNDYKAYLLYLNGLLHEESNNQRARSLYSQVITEFPLSQFRVQAEDRMYAMRASVDSPPITTTTTSPPPTPQTDRTTNVPPVVRAGAITRYEDLTSGAFYIQFGVFTTENAARNYINILNRDQISTFSVTKPVDGRRLNAVIQGPFNTQADANAQRMINKQKNIQSFIFRKD
jgi:cell division septation protein DedD